MPPRCRFLRPFIRSPSLLCVQEFKLSSLSDVVKILQFQSRTEAGFRRNPGGFASILNMALYHHTVSLNYAEVRCVVHRCSPRLRANARALSLSLSSRRVPLLGVFSTPPHQPPASPGPPAVNAL
jgi:hypothetical protein